MNNGSQYEHSGMVFWFKTTKPRPKGFSSCWNFRASSLRGPWMAIQWWFRIAVAYLCGGKFWPLFVSKGVALVQKTEEKTARHCAPAGAWEEVSCLGNCHCHFALLKVVGLCTSVWVFKVLSVWKIETWLKRARWLSRKRQNTVLLLEREKKWAA
jgi:hypothetical protein